MRGVVDPTAGPGPAPASSEVVAARFRRQGRRDTGHEMAVRRRLHARGVRYRVDVRPRPRPEARPERARGEGDGVLPGCFWHGCPSCGQLPKADRGWWAAELAANTARDRRADAVLTGLGWRVLRFWEHEDPDDVADAICAELGRIRAVQSDVSVVPRA